MQPHIMRHCYDFAKPSKIKAYSAREACFLRDKGRPHVTRVIIALLNLFGGDMITRYPYSPDFVPAVCRFREASERKWYEDKRITEKKIDLMFGKIIGGTFLLGWHKRILLNVFQKAHLSKWQLCREITRINYKYVNGF